MKLTGKCKEGFEAYLETQTSISSMYSFRSMPDSCQNSLIIEFFDSKKYFIDVKLLKNLDGNIFGFDSHISFDHHKELYRVNADCLKNNPYETRSEAINKIIEKGNEIYNHKN